MAALCHGLVVLARTANGCVGVGHASVGVRAPVTDEVASGCGDILGGKEGRGGEEWGGVGRREEGKEDQG